MTAGVIFSDLELFLTGFIRAELLARGKSGGLISNEFSPAGKPVPPFQVIVRDDGGPTPGRVTKLPTVGITVLGSDDHDKAETTDLANLVSALMWGCARVEPGNPVAAVLESNGPFKVPDESGQPRRYMTFGLSVVGSPFT